MPYFNPFSLPIFATLFPRRLGRFLCLAVLAWAAAGSSAFAADPAQDALDARGLIHMLDYIAVDYGQCVRDGKVVDASEYAEQVEFAGQVLKRLQAFPNDARRAPLLHEAEQLTQGVANKAAGADVARTAHGLRADLIGAYHVAVAPKKAPDLVRGAALYQENCASCHGAQGAGNGPAAATLDPRPSNFTDEERMKQRSVFALYNVVSLGVEGTAMRAFATLSESERWALALYVSTLRTQPELLAQGERLWHEGKARELLPNLDALTSLDGVEVRERGGAQGEAVFAYLRSHPEILEQSKPSPITISKHGLDEALAHYRAGDQTTAQKAAVSAYLEGFELVEASLDNIAPAQRLAIEREMMSVRHLLEIRASDDALAKQISRTKDMLDQAQQTLGSGALSAEATFTSALLILLREGLEAILVVSAIIAFVRKTGRKDALPWVHGGWIVALVLGGLTWAAASWLIEVSGASREVTEGVTALIAAAMLLYVGLWMHGKSQAHAWQHFIREQVSGALSKGTLATMGLISFLAVYREFFEVVLFYETLWVQAGPAGSSAMLAGIGTALLLLAILTWAMLKLSMRLPLSTFFSISAALMAVLAIVFAGQGIAALQEAGRISASTIDFIRVPMLGIFPTVQSLAAQLITALLIVAGYFAVSRQGTSA